MIRECCCQYASYNGAFKMEASPDCPLHGDLDVLKQIMPSKDYIVLIQDRLKLAMNETYGKETMSYPVAPRVNYNKGLANRPMARQDSWLHSYDGMIEGVKVEFLAGSTHPSGHPSEPQYQLSFNGNNVSKTNTLDFTRNLIAFLQHIVDAEDPGTTDEH